MKTTVKQLKKLIHEALNEIEDGTCNMCHKPLDMWWRCGNPVCEQFYYSDALKTWDYAAMGDPKEFEFGSHDDDKNKLQAMLNGDVVFEFYDGEWFAV